MIVSENGITMWRLALVLFGISAFAGAFMVSPTGASKVKKVATTVRILTIDADNASGSLTSSRPECRRGRKVQLHTVASEEPTIGVGTTDGKGRYLVSLPAGAGGTVYFADVLSVTRRGNENGRKVTFRCGGDESVPAAF